MRRQLNPQLFADAPAEVNANYLTRSESPKSSWRAESTASVGAEKVKPSDLERIEQLTAKAILRLEAENRRLTDELRATQAQQEKLQQTTQAQLQELALSHLNLQKLVEKRWTEPTSEAEVVAEARRLQEQTLQAWIDRHNSLVQDFEAKLKQVQKVASEREMQLLRAMTVLEDMRAELSRLRQPK